MNTYELIVVYIVGAITGIVTNFIVLSYIGNIIIKRFAKQMQSADTERSLDRVNALLAAYKKEQQMYRKMGHDDGGGPKGHS